VHGLSEGDIIRLKTETVARAQGKKEIVFGEASGGWLGLSFDQDRIPLLELLNPILAAFAVKDIKVEEIDMEEVIRRVYEGALG
jgi:ABC-type uncharacterized transport system ATPase subunit